MEPLLLVGVAAAVLGATAALVAASRAQARPADDAATYLRGMAGTTEAPPDDFDKLLAEPFIGRVMRPLGAGVLGAVSGILPSNYRNGIRTKLLHAGMAGRLRPEEVITLQVLAGGSMFLLALLWTAFTESSSQMQLLALVIAPLIGAILPNVWVTRKAAERQEVILRDLPDTIDLLAISVEAGLGFEAALGVVCEHFDSALADEFSRTLQEMELGLPRREALQGLKRRTDVPDLSNFVLALTQADALGMPVGRVLKTQASEMRSKRRQWAREKAGKLPVKILFPLVLFVFPPIFVVILGPAASEISKVF